MSETRWLSDAEQRLWRSYLEGTQRLWDVLTRELDEHGGLSLAEYEVLVRLSEVPDHRLRMSELADVLSHSRSRLTHTVSLDGGARPRRARAAPQRRARGRGLRPPRPGSRRCGRPPPCT